MNKFTNQAIEKLNNEYEEKPPAEILTFAIKEFGGKISLASSFGPEDMVIIDIMAEIKPDARVFLLDTGYIFTETQELVEIAKKRYNIQIDSYSSNMSKIDIERKYGIELYKSNPDMCCKIRKIEPLKRALSGLDAWITGIRRDQSPMRAKAKKIEYDTMFDIVKFNPIANWSLEEVWEYIRKNHIPYNPLHDKNYPSIGCIPCTNAVEPGSDPRSGRWSGKDKTECGLHFDKDGKVVKALERK